MTAILSLVGILGVIYIAYVAGYNSGREYGFFQGLREFSRMEDESNGEDI